MKRKYLFAVSALAAASLAAPASAGIDDNQWQGRVERDPNTYFGFDIDRTQSGKKVAKVGAYLGYSCTNGNQIRAYARIPGRLAVKNGRFAGILRDDNPPSRSARGTADSITYRVRGRFLRGGKARGRIDAELTYSTPGGLGRCYSGDLDWRARRGADLPI